MEKISVIIPMYNSEAYIVQCLRSVMRQTYRELEILLVDDGSEDEGPLICRQLALADNRIRVIRQERGGVSRARNRGLDEASGEYIFFLDSDDAIHPELIEALQGAAREDEAKLLFCEFARADNAQMEAVPESGQGEPRGRIIFQKAEGEKTEEWFHVSHTKELAGIGGKMIKRDAGGDLRFDESLKKGEDTFFLYQLAEKQIPMVCLPKKWYYYRYTRRVRSTLLGWSAAEIFLRAAKGSETGNTRREHILLIPCIGSGWRRSRCAGVIR